MNISLYSVMTLDGKIAHHDHDTLRWTSQEDKQFMERELERFQLIFVARATYDVSSEFFLGKTTVVFTREVDTLTERSPQLFYAPLEGFDPHEMCERVGVDEAVVLGGSYLYSFALQQGWVDSLYLTLEPLVFGQGVPWLSTRDVPDCHQRYQLIEAKPLNPRGTLLLSYRRGE